MHFSFFLSCTTALSIKTEQQACLTSFLLCAQTVLHTYFIHFISAISSSIILKNGKTVSCFSIANSNDVNKAASLSPVLPNV